jgi:hypothetical protein
VPAKERKRKQVSPKTVTAGGAANPDNPGGSAPGSQRPLPPVPGAPAEGGEEDDAVDEGQGGGAKKRQRRTRLPTRWYVKVEMLLGDGGGLLPTEEAVRELAKGAAADPACSINDEDAAFDACCNHAAKKLTPDVLKDSWLWRRTKATAKRTKKAAGAYTRSLYSSS